MRRNLPISLHPDLLAVHDNDALVVPVDLLALEVVDVGIAVGVGVVAALCPFNGGDIAAVQTDGDRLKTVTSVTATDYKEVGFQKVPLPIYFA